MKNYLFILRHAPHNGNHVQEALDMVLTTAAFDQQVALLLIDDGVLPLHPRQAAETLQKTDTAAVFQALQIYDIQTIHVETESLRARGLQETDLILPVQLVARADISQLISRYQVVVSD